MLRVSTRSTATTSSRNWRRGWPRSRGGPRPEPLLPGEAAVRAAAEEMDAVDKIPHEPDGRCRYEKGALAAGLPARAAELADRQHLGTTDVGRSARGAGVDQVGEHVGDLGAIDGLERRSPRERHEAV